VLTTAEGRPIESASIDVIATDRRRGAREHKVASVTTDALGRFDYSTHRGASRTLRFAFKAFALDEAPVAVADLELNVRAGVTLRVRPHKVTPRGRIVLTGRLLGGPGRRDTQIGLFAVARRGRDRVPVTTVVADLRGRFPSAYRFQRTFAPFTYYFRTIVRRQNGYPYATGRSARAKVEIVR
jgi:hypothetical protein